MTANATTFGLTLPEEERREGDHDEAYRRLLERLSHQSVVKHYDAYEDVPWDDPAYAIDPTDPRFELDDDDPLGATEWYRSQSQPTRARLGLHLFATFARTGWEFESILKRGMLEFTGTLPPAAPEFRYCYHEVIEEAQHSLIFREFVVRTGLDVRPPRILKLAQREVVPLGRRFPELFFFLVLSGEDPIDWYQRRQLQSRREHHPLVDRISRIHITEEARHMSFARHFLRRNVPRLSGFKRFLMRVRTPGILRVATAIMLKPTPHLVSTYAIPDAVMREAYGPGSAYQRLSVEALRKPRELCWELGILTPGWARWWRALGVSARRPGSDAA